jgi:hypothetical protein
MLVVLAVTPSEFHIIRLPSPANQIRLLILNYIYVSTFLIGAHPI